jgi:hypothetical protein
MAASHVAHSQRCERPIVTQPVWGKYQQGASGKTPDTYTRLRSDSKTECSMRVIALKVTGQPRLHRPRAPPLLGDSISAEENSP